jgi:two-component system OmpR family response regulator
MSPTATTIVVAREDFSIPGGSELAESPEPVALESRFFSLIEESKPDVVVLDLSRADGAGIDAISKIREQSSLPILVICGQNQKHVQDYRIAGAAGCIAAPVDLVSFNQALQYVVQGGGVQTGGSTAEQKPAPEVEETTLAFAGVSFRPRENIVATPGGRNIRLTPAESRLLAHFAHNPWEIQSRPALAEALYGTHRPVVDRAVDGVVDRLRAKLRLVGETTQFLIKTEFRGGYRFVSDASVEQ